MQMIRPDAARPEGKWFLKRTFVTFVAATAARSELLLP